MIAIAAYGLTKAFGDLTAVHQLSLEIRAGEVLDERRLLVSGLAHEQIPDAIAALVAADVRIYGVTPQQASLEDVYFALHTRASTQGSSS